MNSYDNGVFIYDTTYPPLNFSNFKTTSKPSDKQKTSFIRHVKKFHKLSENFILPIGQSCGEMSLIIVQEHILPNITEDILKTQKNSYVNTLKDKDKIAFIMKLQHDLQTFIFSKYNIEDKIFETVFHSKVIVDFITHIDNPTKEVPSTSFKRFLIRKIKEFIQNEINVTTGKMKKKVSYSRLNHDLNVLLNNNMFFHKLMNGFEKQALS